MGINRDHPDRNKHTPGCSKGVSHHHPNLQWRDAKAGFGSGRALVVHIREGFRDAQLGEAGGYLLATYPV